MCYVSVIRNGIFPCCAACTWRHTHSKTTLIICCTPEQRHTPETLSTLRFGERAKRIKNNAKVNEELSPDELKVLLQSARKEVVTLKRRVKKFASVMATSLTEDNLSSVQEQLSSLQALVNDVDGGDDYAGGTRTAAGIASLTPSNSLLGSDSTGDGTPRADIYHSHSGTVSLDVTKELADLNSKIKQLEDELVIEKERCEMHLLHMPHPLHPLHLLHLLLSSFVFAFTVFGTLYE